jgi:hypothetical protein
MELVIRGITPLSYNSKRKDVYQEKIRSAFLRKFKGNVPKFPTGIELYAKAFFFTSDGVNVDTDNISKPIWDALNGLLYDDDRNIVLRMASVIDVKRRPITIDTTNIDGDVAAELIQGLAEKNVKCLYLECSKFHDTMVKIGEIST